MKKPSELAITTAAQVWCDPRCSGIEMDTRLAEVFAEKLDAVWSQPWLGNATTGELLNEIAARVNTSYKTVGLEEVVQPVTREP